MPALMRQRGAIGLLAAVLLGLTIPGDVWAEGDGWFKRNFIDPEDGALDASEWLSKGGFLPFPVIVTEPAVQDGLGLALAFIGDGDPESRTPPPLTAVLGLKTGNRSQAYGAFHEGTYANGNLKLTGVVAQADVNLDFYTGGSRPFGYNIDGTFASATGTYRLGDSNWFAGMNYRYQGSKVRFRGGGGSGLLPQRLDVTLSGLALVLDHDSLDNIFTPNNGISARFSVTRYDAALGSNYDFTKGHFSTFAYHALTEHLTLGAKVIAESAHGDVPFFALPAINLRGIPALRYQGDSAVSTEFEATYKFAPRWRAVGFGGVGWADNTSAGADRRAKAAFGVGIRYQLARSLGADIGLDVARGPEETVVYLQFGRAWRRF